MVELFLKEAVIMKDFQHVHVLGIRGIAFDEDNSPMVVLPYMSNGDLRNYILNPQLVRPSSENIIVTQTFPVVIYNFQKLLISFEFLEFGGHLFQRSQNL